MRLPSPVQTRKLRSMARPEIHHPKPDAAERVTEPMDPFITEIPARPWADVWRCIKASGMVGLLPLGLWILARLSALIPFAGFYIAIILDLLTCLAALAVLPAQAVIFNHALNRMTLRGLHLLVVTLSCLFFTIGPCGLLIFVGLFVWL